jgi:hypothetical protein
MRILLRILAPVLGLVLAAAGAVVVARTRRPTRRRRGRDRHVGERGEQHRRLPPAKIFDGRRPRCPGHEQTGAELGETIRREVDGLLDELSPLGGRG